MIIIIIIYIFFIFIINLGKGLLPCSLLVFMLSFTVTEPHHRSVFSFAYGATTVIAPVFEVLWRAASPLHSDQSIARLARSPFIEHCIYFIFLRLIFY